LLSLLGTVDWLAPFSGFGALDWESIVTMVADPAMSFGCLLLLIPCGLLLLADY
jgi:hypothetical protein